MSIEDRRTIRLALKWYQQEIERLDAIIKLYTQDEPGLAAYRQMDE